MGPNFWREHSGFCHLIGMVCSVSCVCSLWSIGAISLNRYILLCRQHLYRRLYTLKNTIAMCVGLWIATVLLDLPNFLDWGDHAYDMKTMACSYDRTASYSYTAFFIMTFVSLPLLIVVFCNINIYVVVLRSKIRVRAASTAQSIQAWSTEASAGASTAYIYVDNESATALHPRGQLVAVKKVSPNKLKVPATGDQAASSLGDTRSQAQQKEMAAGNRKPRGRNMKSEVKLAKTLFIIFIAFVACWTPYALICLIDKKDTVSKEAYTIAVLLAHTSSTLNSVLYAATNKGFRQGYKLFLNKCGCKIS